MKKTKKYLVGLYAALAMLALTGCGGKSADNMAIAETTAASSMQTAGGIYEMGIEADKGTGLMEDAVEQEASAENSAYRKLIKTVSMDVETEEFDSMMTNLKNRVEELSGYIENSSVRGNSRYDEKRYADMTIRIPQDKLDYFVDEVAEISNIIWKSENVDDITLTYVDIESREKALEIEQERLLSLLEKAESVEDIITIEGRLSEVRYELQSYASQLLVYDNQVNYSTVYLNISEVKRLTPQEEPTIWNRIATGFSDNLGGVVTLMENLFVGVIVLIPYWGLWVIIIAVIAGMGKGISAAQKKKKAKEAAEKKE